MTAQKILEECNGVERDADRLVEASLSLERAAQKMLNAVARFNKSLNWLGEAWSKAPRSR